MYLSICLVGKTLVFKLRGPEFEPRCGQLDHCDSVQNRLSTTTLLLIQASGLTLWLSRTFVFKCRGPEFEPNCGYSTFFDTLNIKEKQ